MDDGLVQQLAVGSRGDGTTKMSDEDDPFSSLEALLGGGGEDEQAESESESEPEVELSDGDEGAWVCSAQCCGSFSAARFA